MTHVFADSRITLLCHALRICVAHAPTESCPFSLLVITGLASLAEQISPEHGCSLSPLVQRLVPFLTLSTLDVGYKEAACGC